MLTVFSAAFYNQITQTMQIPLSYAVDIIRVEGRSIEFIRRSSGALLTVQESRGLPDEITVEIKGTSSQVQAAQQLIQEVIATSNKDQIPSSYGRMDTRLRSSYSVRFYILPFLFSILATLIGGGLGLQVVKYLAAKYEELGCEVKWMGKPDKVI